MGGDRFGFSSFLDHEELGKDGHRLQVDGERPKDLHHWELVVQDQRQNDSRDDQELNPEKYLQIFLILWVNKQSKNLGD